MSRSEGPGSRPSIEAKFRIFGDEVVPADVTAVMGIDPDRVASKGEPLNWAGIRADRIAGTGVWLIESAPCEAASLEVHLRWLLARIEPVASGLKEAVERSGGTAEFLCKWFLESFNEEQEFEPDTLARIARLGATLRFDTWSSVD